MPPTTSIDDANVATLTKKKVNASSKLYQISEKDIVKGTLIGNAWCRGIELVNFKLQHKNKHEDESVNDTINHTIVENSNASDGKNKNIGISGKTIDEEIVKVTNSITIQHNTSRKLVSEDKLTNALEGEKENTISCVIKTSKTLKEDFKKQLLEQREGTSGLRVKLKTEIDSSTKRKI